ncbi:hypothetical protein LTR78_008315 [Recurvomyces mirabilis]|uniref:Uncharacterized protein n=1 Tax=Recurvomyces mirabilis TaxID=574656 RepID=A0AAE0TTU0_9PEZI|nr:hypothetical protein LTR78_008315 [Recurvomyces mirabilis]KAK5158560.1 hypothetical protein LTS14_003580 [Recurvomyces mirabilis]
MTAQPARITTRIRRASLLGLPAELRLRIYSFYLRDLLVIVHRQNTSHKGPDDLSYHHTILEVCRTIRREIHIPFLQTITFELRDLHTECNFSAWLDNLGDKAVTNLRRLNFDCVGKCSQPGRTEDEEADAEVEVEADAIYCYRELHLDLTTPDAADILDIRDLHPMDLCDYSDEELNPFCSSQALPCVELNCAAEIEAVEQLTWREGVPVVTKERLLRVWRSLCQDNEDAVVGSDDDEAGSDDGRAEDDHVDDEADSHEGGDHEEVEDEVM